MESFCRRTVFHRHTAALLCAVATCTLCLPVRAQAPAEGLCVQYRCAETGLESNQIKAHFQIANRTAAAVPLKELTIRYWYDDSSGKPQSFWCDYAALGKENVSAEFVALKKPLGIANCYVELGFSEGAGSVAAGGNSGEIQSRVSRQDWGNYDQLSAYSFEPSCKEWTEHPKVTLYRLGQLVWGQEPGGRQARFLLYDESRGILHYVNQRDPAKDWELNLGHALRDFQLIGNHQFIIAQGFGYSVWDLQTRKLVQDIHVPDLGGGISARRRADGATVIGANARDGVLVVELDKQNAVARRATFPGVKTLRMLRLASDGNVLLAEESGLTEVAFDAQAPGGGKVVRRIPLPHDRNAFMALKKEDGSYVLSGGFAKALFEFAPDGKLRREFALKDAPAAAGPLFFAGFQVLKNGNIVVCNWTGHGAQDSAKGWQLVEFAADSSLVWHWHEPNRAGTALNIVVLDGLDENAFLDDSSGVLQAVDK